MSLLPSLLIGDLDSISEADLQSLTGRSITILKYPREKDETDLELALGWAVDHGFRSIRVAGALGGRLDQMLGNLFLLTWDRLEGLDVRLDDGCEEVFLISRSAEVHGTAGDTISLIPLLGPATGITTEGLEYPLRGETLFPERTRGISNQMLNEQAIVSLESGCLLCIHTRQAFTEP
jgi:thiamine pyrophosphokinase